MLILELKANDPIRVGECVIHLDHVRFASGAGRVWLAFDAPREVDIVRQSIDKRAPKDA